MVRTQRFNDQVSIDEVAIAGVISRGERPCIQYSKPVYSPELLRQIDSLCARHGGKLNIRFYGHHYGSGFDFRALEHIPHVQSLAVDCLHEISNLDVLFTLPALRDLSFGVYADIPPDFLFHPNLAGLISLNLGDAKKPAIDLAGISELRSLEDLGISGFYKNIGAMAGLPALKRLSLASIKNTISLDFISRMAPLRKLRILLGGRDNIHEIKHSGLEHLEVIRVRGFSELHPDNFPGLRFLQIEDHIQMNSLAFTSASARLATIHVRNCKKLSNITGIRNLEALDELRIWLTAVPFGAISGMGLPPSLRVFSFCTGKVSQDRKIRQNLDTQGYAEYSHQLTPPAGKGADRADPVPTVKP